MSQSELKRILYVEDEPDIQAVAKIALEAVGGFELAVFSAGAEAVANAVAFAPQLLLLDVMMPGMDGPTTLTELRKLPELAQVPVIFMTAKVQPQEVAHFKSLGAIEVIAKPFDPMTLAQSVLRAWSAKVGQ